MTLIIALLLAALQAGPTPLSIGETVAGDLNTNDLQLADSTYVDLYRFRGAAGQQVVLTVTSTALDPSVTLNQVGGSFGAQDEDSGGGKNAKVAVTLPAAADYDIRVTAADGASGAYSLKLEAAPR